MSECGPRFDPQEGRSDKINFGFEQDFISEFDGCSAEWFFTGFAEYGNFLALEVNAEGAKMKCFQYKTFISIQLIINRVNVSVSEARNIHIWTFLMIILFAILGLGRYNWNTLINLSISRPYM